MTHPIPKNWQEVLLDSVTKRGSGHTPNKKHPEYWDGEIKWISLKDSDRLDDLYIYNTVSKITPEGIANSSAVLHTPGTVILSRDAGVGKSAIMKEEMAVSQHFMAWQCGPRLDNHFLYHWLQTEKPEFERIAVGSTIKTIGLSYFKHLKILLPPLSEQRRIVKILETWGDAIKKLEKKVQLKKVVRAGLAQRLLTGKLRLPGYRDNWTQVKLGSCLEEVNSKTTYSDQYEILTSSRRGIFLQSEYFDKQVASGNNAGYKIIRRGEFTYRTMTDDGLFAFNRLKHLEIGIVSPAYVVFTTKKIDASYLEYLMNEKKFRADVLQYAQGGTRRSLKFKSLVEVIIRVPQIKEQEAIINILINASHGVDVLQKKLDSLKIQKKFLLHSLTSGRIRTPENMPIPKS